MKRDGTLVPRGADSHSKIIKDRMQDEAERFTSVTETILELQTTLNSRTRTKGEVVRNAVAQIEECVWNGPEFYLPRDVRQIRIGIMGPSASSRQELLEKFGGNGSISLNKFKGLRFKRTTVVDESHYLVLIREEVGEPPEDFCGWVDVLILVCDSWANTKLARDYLKLFGKTKDIDSVSVVLGYVEASRKNLKKRAFKEKFFELNSTGRFFNCEVDVSDTSSVNNLFQVACSAHTNKVDDVIIPTHFTSTPARLKNSIRPISLGSPINLEHDAHLGLKTPNQDPVVTPPVTIGTAHLFTPAPEYDDFLMTPAQAPRNASIFAVSERLGKKSTRKVQFTTPPKCNQHRMEFKTPARTMSPHISILISPDSPLAVTPSVKSPYVSILLESD